MSVLNGNIIAGSSGGGGGGGGGAYTIDNSLRFNDDDSAYLSRTPASAGNRKTWTWSGWVKRGNTAKYSPIFYSNNGASAYDAFVFNSSDQLYFIEYTGAATVCSRTTNRLFRDPSAWYHIILVVDANNATVSDRAKIYINGIEETSFASSGAHTGADGYINTAQPHYLMSQTGTYCDGYLSEVNFIDGLALTPASFGEFGTYGEWKPLAYTGSYGTNGFYLDFANSGDLGNDVSGNANDWTPTNLAATDQMLDSPTNNFAVISPIMRRWAVDSITNSEGNLKCSSTSNSDYHFATVSGVNKCYFEMAIIADNAEPWISLHESKRQSSTGGGVIFYGANGYVKVGASISTAASYTTGDIVAIAFDIDVGAGYVYKNNTLVFSATGEDFNVFEDLIAGGITGSSDVVMYNFGQDSSFAGNKTAQGNSDSNGIGDFYYTPPAGFLALCTQNLPAPTVVPSEHFNTVLYSGNSSSNSITGVGFEADFTWAKNRTNANHNTLYDVVRDSFLYSNLTNSEDSNGGFITIDSDGFTYSGASNELNLSGSNYASWNWKANGTGVSNTDGSITSTVSANVDAGFSIISYSGNATAGATVGHGLSVAPEMFIVKERTSDDNWYVYHSSNTSAPETDHLRLNLTNATQDSLSFWNDTLPSSSVFTLGTTTGVNSNSDTYITYAWHSVDGYSKVGSYTGNGSTDGPFVHCGFRPAYVLVKRTNATQDWVIYDAKRDSGNPIGYILEPNTSDAEAQRGQIDSLANGFKLRGTNSVSNTSSSTYIYLAFAESPFKYSNAR
jgi:hypothetical protein